jgi:hypothetical protein
MVSSVKFTDILNYKKGNGTLNDWSEQSGAFQNEWKAYQAKYASWSNIEGAQLNIGYSAYHIASMNGTISFARSGKEKGLFWGGAVNYGANADGGGWYGDFNYFGGKKNDPSATLKDFGGGSESTQVNAIMFTGGMSKSVNPETHQPATGYDTYNYGVALGEGINRSTGRTWIWVIK